MLSNGQIPYGSEAARVSLDTALCSEMRLAWHLAEALGAKRVKDWGKTLA